MPRAYLSEVQHAKLQQNDLYRIMRRKRGELKVSGTVLAEACDESRKTFWYRFENQILEPWEIIICCKVLKIKLGVCENDGN